MGRIHAHSTETPWVPRSDADIDREDPTKYQRQREEAEAKAAIRVAKYKSGTRVSVEYRFISGERLMLRGVLIRIVAWSIDASVLVAYIDMQGQVMRVDATRLRKAR